LPRLLSQADEGIPMLRLIISVNETPVTVRSAHNITEKLGGTYGKGKQTYLITDCLQNDTWLLDHIFEQGANVLAKKMLTKPTAGKTKIKQEAR
jgi:hypothetical protein